MTEPTTTDPRARLDGIKARADKLDDVNSADIGLQMSVHYAVDTMLREDHPAMAAALTAVLDLHAENPGYPCADNAGCNHCYKPYPCPTVSKIQEVLDASA